MFQKYVRKLSNTINTVNYIKKQAHVDCRDHMNGVDYKKVKTKENSSIHYDRKLSTASSNGDRDYSDDSDDHNVNQNGTDGNNNDVYLLDTSILALPAAQIILSTAIADLRNTLLLYELVFKVFLCLLIFILNYSLLNL